METYVGKISHAGSQVVKAPQEGPKAKGQVSVKKEK